MQSLGSSERDSGYRIDTVYASKRPPEHDLQARVEQLEGLLLETKMSNKLPRDFDEGKRALEREWQTVQDLHEEVSVLKAELEMGKLPSEPSERRRLFMRKMDALQAKVAALEAETAVLRQNCKEVLNQLVFGFLL
jgi:uncharacterized protein YceH (UPF0502 family)